MFKHFCKGISIVGLLFSCWTGMVHADETTMNCGKGEKACDITFLFEAAFANMCDGAVQKRIYTIQNNSPVTKTIGSIQVLNADGSINPSASIPGFIAPTNPCGTTIAAGASCNIEVDVAPSPTVPEDFNLQLVINLPNSNQRNLISPITLSSVAGCNVSFSTPTFTDVCTTGGPETRTYTITNNSTVPLTVQSIPIILRVLPNDPLANGDVAVTGGTCVTGFMLNPTGTCTVDVTIQGSGGIDTGTLNRQLQVLFNDGVTVLPPIISARILPAPCNVAFSSTFPTPTAMNCGIVQPLIYTLKNTTGVAFPITSIVMNIVDTTLATSTITSFCGASLPANSSCTIEVDLFEACSGSARLDTLNRTLTVNGSILAPTINSTITVPALPPQPATDYLTPAGRGCAVLGGTADVTNTGNTVVTNGDVCVSPGTSITGFLTVDGGPGVIAGVVGSPSRPAMAQINTNPAQLAYAALTGAIVTLQNLPCTQSFVNPELGGLTLTAGVYCLSSAAQLTGTITLQGGINDLFVFKIGTTLTTANSSQVVLVGVNPSNVYWVEGTSATLGSSTIFQGNILAQASITMGTGASLVYGRALGGAAVTLNNNAITNPPIAP